jgi:hypothetical protein
MEALTAASVAALTVYDMCKAVDRGMVIGEIRLVAQVRRQVRRPGTRLHDFGRRGPGPIRDQPARRSAAEQVSLARPWPRAGRGSGRPPDPAAVRRLGHGRLCGARRRCRDRAETVEAGRLRPGRRRHDGTVEAGEAVRIFTGAPVPDGADAIVIQEDTEARRRGAGGDTVGAVRPAGHVRRPASISSRARSASRGRAAADARDVGLAAAMNRPWLLVHRRPRVAILPTGDEVALPGDPIGPNQIVSSNGIAARRLVAAAGGVRSSWASRPTTSERSPRHGAGAAGADLLVTIGGASVGEHDLVQKALGAGGLALDFWKIAMRPGKPLMFGRMGALPVLGLPGNPVSALVCGHAVPGAGAGAAAGLAGRRAAAGAGARRHRSQGERRAAGLSARPPVDSRVRRDTGRATPSPSRIPR